MSNTCTCICTRACTCICTCICTCTCTYQVLSMPNYIMSIKCINEVTNIL